MQGTLCCDCNDQDKDRMVEQLMNKELAEAHRVISSFRSKSEKSSLRLKEGSWQSSLVCSYVKAADIALKLIEDDGDLLFDDEELNGAYKSLTGVLLRAEQAIGRFPAGSSQHTLQKNRISAFKTALRLIEKHQGIS